MAARGKRKPRGGSSVMEGRARTAKGDLSFFPTPPWAARAGGELILEIDPFARDAWECAAGAGHMVHGLNDYFAKVYASDVADYGAGFGVHDFLTGQPSGMRCDWIVTNPPFPLAEAFVRQAWPLASRGVAMLCRLGFKETVGRHKLLFDDCPLAVCATFAERVPMFRGVYRPRGRSATAYAWFVFLKPDVIAGTVAAEAIAAAHKAGGYIELGIAPGTRKRLTCASDALAFPT